MPVGPPLRKKHRFLGIDGGDLTRCLVDLPGDEGSLGQA
jgi:hypothetical protein